MSSAYGDGMPVRYQIRPLGDLPWPHGLGKSEYPELEWRLKRHLGSGYGSRAVHEHALHCDPLYRMIAQDELSKLSWATDLLGAVDDVTVIASGRRCWVARSRMSRTGDRGVGRFGRV